jgi:putative membrane protein
MTIITSQTIVQKPFRKQPLHMAYISMFLLFWFYSALSTPDLTNWLTENILTLSLLIFLVAFYNIFRFSDTSYSLIFLFLLLHVFGSQYQYTENPLGEWLQHQFNQSRNNYDRMVHFGFGLLLTYPIHEVLLRGLKLNRFLSYLLPVELVLSLGALYELIEWAVADLLYHGTEQGMDFLGMQGDIWDAQKDIGLGFLGSIVAISATILFRKVRK